MQGKARVHASYPARTRVFLGSVSVLDSFRFRVFTDHTYAVKWVLLSLYSFRIVRNRASESVRGSSKDSGSVGDPGSPHGSPNGTDALQRGGTYSISGILGIAPQGTSPITDHNGNTGTKRKLDETREC